MDRKNLAGKLLIYGIALFLACGCSPPPESGAPPESSSVSSSSAPSSSVPPEEEPLPEPSWEDYEPLDLAGEPVVDGEPVEFWVEGVTARELSYTYGWDLEQEGYIRLDDGEPTGKWGGARLLETRSVYYLYPAYTEKLQLSQSSYCFSPASAVPGILQVDRYAVLFFPYKSVKEPFFRVEPRDRDREKEYREVTVLSCADGIILEIKPLAIQFWEEDNETLVKLLEISGRDEMDDPRWFDVELGFSSVEIGGWSDNPLEVLTTRIFGELAEEAPLTVKGELSLPERIWTGFAYWYFPRGEE